MSTARKNLIIGAAIGYAEPQIAPFVRSLRRTGYDGDLLLIVDARLARALRASDEYRGCELREAPPWVPHRLRLKERHSRYWSAWGLAQRALRLYLRVCDRLPLGQHLRRELQIGVAQHGYWPTETRYFHALRFLQSHRYARVLLSDVRDVLFQSDPFVQLPLRGLGVGMETRRLTLATEPFNARQVTMAYGVEGLRELGSRPISCCGVTCGDYDSMLRYLDLMVREIFGLGPAAARHPMDQALHNFILWTGRFGKFSELDTLAGPIATLAMLDERELRVSPEGYLLNRDGSVPSIVHQHDRWPQLAQGLERLLASRAPALATR